MPQQTYAGFTPDPEPDYSGFTPDKPAQTETPGKGYLEEWNDLWINKPLSYQLTGGKSAAPAVSEYLDNPADRREDDMRFPDWMPMVGGGSLRSMAAGMYEGITNVAEGFTSPLNLATMGAGAMYGRAAKTATTLPGIAESVYSKAPQVAENWRRA